MTVNEVEDSSGLAPTIFGILLAGLAVLTIGMWVGGRDSGDDGALPQLELISPVHNDTIDAPFAVTFSTDARLVKAPEGWRAGRLHLHARLDGVEHMPAAADVEAMGDNRFVWNFPGIGAGPHQVKLLWSDPEHRPLAEGASESVEFLILPAGELR